MKSLWDIGVQSRGYSAGVKSAEVVVIGAGLAGLLTAWELCQQGRSVLVLEAREVGSGTSGHTTGKITSQHCVIYHNLLNNLGLEKAKIYAESNQWAVKAYIDLINQQAIDCHLHEHPAYVYSDTDIDTLKKENNAALQIGLPSSLETVSISSNPALCFRQQAQFHPKKFMLALADLISKNGGYIAEHKRVVEVDESKSCVIRTEDGETIEADYVIYTTLFPILDHFYYAVRLKPVQHFGIAYTYDKQEFEGMYIGINGISFRYHEDALIAIGREHKMGHTEHAYSDLDQEVRAKFHVKEEITRWSAHDHNSGDLVPYIGPYHPGSKRRFAATGFKAWGITHSMVAAKLISDQIWGRENPWSELYSPNRTSQAFKTMMEQTKSAIKHLVQSGTRCTHMGCTLSDNKDDGTLDCPCHGSRFDMNGRILWGPAIRKIMKLQEKR